MDDEGLVFENDTVNGELNETNSDRRRTILYENVSAWGINDLEQDVADNGIQLVTPYLSSFRLFSCCVCLFLVFIRFLIRHCIFPNQSISFLYVHDPSVPSNLSFKSCHLLGMQRWSILLQC